MKKIISLTLILLLLGTALAGCSGGASEAAAAPEQETTKVEENNTETAKEEPKAEEKAVEEVVSYKDGTYEGVGEGMHTIKVAVEVAGGKIAKVEIKEHEESKGVAEPALEQIPAAIVEKNSPDVEVVSGATLASEGIINAVKNALEAAK
ncbi:MAG TPA: FMN-binding protein [Clostridia bacterium]|nr:FMN-binding protein [Clostridia bacterium]